MRLPSSRPARVARPLCGVLVALTLACAACTPMRVLTHSVSASEAQVPPGRYTLDAHHWSIVFDVDHFHYSRFVMRFDKASATLDWQPGGLAASRVDAIVDAGSVNTNVPLLDRMVRGTDMLDVAQYGQIRFVSTGFEPAGEARGTAAGERAGKPMGKLHGDLTIHGTTRPVTLEITFNGYGRNPLTKQGTLGFSADGHFSRAGFGLATWFPAVGDDVHVHIESEFEAPPPEAAAG